MILLPRERSHDASLRWRGAPPARHDTEGMPPKMMPCLRLRAQDITRYAYSATYAACFAARDMREMRRHACCSSPAAVIRVAMPIPLLRADSMRQRVRAYSASRRCVARQRH